MLDAKEKALVEDAMRLIRRHATNDHYCDDDNCTVDTPCCTEMEARAALVRLEETLDPAVRTLHASRLTGPAERIYFNEWKRENERANHINSGFTALEWILCPSEQSTPDRPSQRDAEVATTVIQWLGTNCGKCFVDRCERKIIEERALRSELDRHTVRLGADEDRDLFDRLLDVAIRNTLPPVKEADKVNLGKYGLAELRRKLAEVCHLMFGLFAFQTGELSLVDAANSVDRRPESFKELHKLALLAVEKRVQRMERKRANSTGRANA